MTDNKLELTAILAEYNSLRTEISSRHRMRNQILIFTITVLGLVLSLPLANDGFHKMALYYPVLAAFLAASWSQHDLRIGQIGEHIALEIEPRVPELTWERSLRKDRVTTPPRSFFRPVVRISEFYALGIFVGSQLLAIVLSLPTIILATDTYLILTMDIVAILISIKAVTQRAFLYPSWGVSNGKD